jgi:hypothetical protein
MFGGPSLRLGNISLLFLFFSLGKDGPEYLRSLKILPRGENNGSSKIGNICQIIPDFILISILLKEKN